MRAIILEGNSEEVSRALLELGVKQQDIVLSKDTDSSQSEVGDQVGESEGCRPMPVAVARGLLSRRPLSGAMAEAIVAIYNSGKEGIFGNELCDLLSHSPAQFRGMMGAFGRRMWHTPGYEKDMFFFEQDWDNEHGFRYSLPETSRLAVEAELSEKLDGER
ncbi:hypothetical protein [Erythrobacter sp. EC-HK427]|uniref:hypothetical protein n=1 Tax=Erythrobacter sp. EC-HK427 TaxID=2038396 RepID=UPI00125327C4|nr:hypothetical protein [Erythrobacter sp. EC-HK427]VVT04907.1 conserved hypothetical protein [Erythrobacter sp. EC-HK427]